MLNLILKNVFTCLCLAITLILISQLLHTYLIKKPTTTTKIEKELEPYDLPEVVVCLDPGFSKTSANKYGYHVSLYWAGLRTPDLSFIGWNGKENESRSSREILEEMFLLPANQTIIKAVAYTENYDDTYKADVTFKRLIYPRGRCMIVNPPINRTLSDKTPNRLTVAFRDSFVDQLKHSSANL